MRDAYSTSIGEILVLGFALAVWSGLLFAGGFFYRWLEERKRKKETKDHE